MDERFRRWITPRSEVESAYEDVEPHRQQSSRERLAEQARLSRMALAFLDQLPASERDRLLQLQDEMEPEHMRAWLALVRRSRGE